MSQKLLTKPEGKTSIEDELAKRCVHYWIIEPPTESVSKGVCKICGAEREFNNFITPELSWK